MSGDIQFPTCFRSVLWQLDVVREKHTTTVTSLTFNSWSLASSCLAIHYTSSSFPLHLLDHSFSLRSWSFQYLLLHSPLSWWLCSLFHRKMEVLGNKLSRASTIEHTDLPAFIPRYLAVSSACSMCDVCSYHYLRPKLGVDPEENSDTHFQWVIKSH